MRLLSLLFEKKDDYYNEKQLRRWIDIGFELGIYKRNDSSDKNIERVMDWIEILGGRYIGVGKGK
jgi:hypothetical protein